jgi:hypothetical protein
VSHCVKGKGRETRPHRGDDDLNISKDWGLITWRVDFHLRKNRAPCLRRLISLIFWKGPDAAAVASAQPLPSPNSPG